MNQIEWCQVRLDITQEIQVTRRSKLPGDLLGNLPGDPALGNLPGDLALGNLPGDPVLAEIYPEIRCWEIYPEIFKLKPGTFSTGKFDFLKPYNRHHCTVKISLLRA